MGLYWAKKENGNYFSMLGLLWDNGKEHGNYFNISPKPLALTLNRVMEEYIAAIVPM